MKKHTILFLAANPSGTDRLALDREARAIQMELERSGYRDCFKLETRWAAEPLDLLRELRKLKPTVVHFSGHGGQSAGSEHQPAQVPHRDVIVGKLDPQGGEPQHGLIFHGPSGRAQVVSTAALEKTIDAAGTSVKLVLLSACYSEAHAAALLTHVDCVVGMSGSIHDDAARNFAIGFYGGLGERESVAAAYKQGCAAISLEGLRDADRPQLKVRDGVNASQLVLATDLSPASAAVLRARPVPLGFSHESRGVTRGGIIDHSSDHEPPPLGAEQENGYSWRRGLFWATVAILLLLVASLILSVGTRHYRQQRGLRMSVDDVGSTITDAAETSSMNAQGGFDYQLWDVLSRIPAWLANPAFEGVIFESPEDFEARFFAPHAPQHRIVERYQGKSAQLDPKEVRETFERFRTFETKHSSVVRVYTLVTPRLPPTLDWVGRDVARIRKARPFYAPFPSVVDASDAKLRNHLIDEFGENLGRFVADSVEVSERVLPDRDSGLNAFGVALARAFPALDVGPRQIAAAFGAIEKLARGSMGKTLWRKELLSAIETEISTKLLPEAFPIHVRSDRNDSNEMAMEIDASAFSGGLSPFPDPAMWTNHLVLPLQETARWLVARQVSRVSLGGFYRLTTAFVLGWAFRATSGFELEISTRGGTWNTDDRPLAGAEPTMKIDEPRSLVRGRLLVAVGVLRRPADDLVASGVDPSALLSIEFKEPISSGREAERIVSLVKTAVASVVSRLRPDVIDLYLASPAAFAVSLGHRWNAMGPTQIYEFVQATRTYVPTAALP